MLSFPARVLGKPTLSIENQPSDQVKTAYPPNGLSLGLSWRTSGNRPTETAWEIAKDFSTAQLWRKKATDRASFVPFWRPSKPLLGTHSDFPNGFFTHSGEQGRGEGGRALCSGHLLVGRWRRTLALIVTLQPPTNVPGSPLASSKTHSCQGPLGFLPSNVGSCAKPLGAGAILEKGPASNRIGPWDSKAWAGC